MTLLADKAATSNLDVSDTRLEDAARVARALRRQAAVDGEFIRNLPTAAPKEIAELNRFAAAIDLGSFDSKQVLAHSLSLSDKLLDRLLANPGTLDQRLQVAAVVQHVIESELLELFAPDGSGKAIRHELLSKESGAFFTPMQVALWMAKAALDEHTHEPPRRFYDPAAGIGTFPCAVIYHLAKRRLSYPITYDIGDLNGRYLRIAERVIRYVAAEFPIKLVVRREDALTSAAEGYDVVVMNPPYGRLKAFRTTHAQRNTKTRFSNAEVDREHEEAKTRLQENIASLRGSPTYSELVAGTLEKSRLFTIKALAALRDRGVLTVIAPDSWLTDHGSKRFRRFLRQKHSIRCVALINESARLFTTVNQPLAITTIRKAAIANEFRVIGPTDKFPSTDREHQVVCWTDLERLDPDGLAITALSNVDLKIVDKLNRHPRLSGLDWIVNRRGECDLTAFKKCLSALPTGTRLVRGDHIERYELRSTDHSQREGYIRLGVFRKALRSREKLAALDLHRIAGRQVSYLEKPRRFSFASIPPGHVLANSCNYLLVNPGNRNQLRFPPWRHYYLLGLLNSVVLEWHFRHGSRTNHVNNADLDRLPIPDADTQIARSIAHLAAKCERARQRGEDPTTLESDLEALVALGYGLTEAEFRRILASFPTIDRSAALDSYASLARATIDSQQIANHDASPLSDLDFQIVGHIPPGGNWTSVPETIPSKRIEQIRAMTAERGGVVRTSYYGRLLENQPSYTISTYFSRPGNGTHILPDQERTLSTREAARLQSFPDGLRFVGSRRAQHEQVGNAVPPLLAYAVAKSIKSATHRARPTHVDFFAGAGGLSLGFHWAGFDLVAAQELGNDHSDTFASFFQIPKAKFPETIPRRGGFMLQGDIRNAELRVALFSAIDCRKRKRPIDVVVGGPPCQGFSFAGRHDKNDARNNLASLYVECIGKIRPRYFVLENVEGLRFMDGGRVVKDLISAFRAKGYIVSEPWVLKAEEFGVPQMRRRVFLVGSLPGETPVARPEPCFEACKGRRSRSQADQLQGELPLAILPRPISIADAIADLPRLDAGETTTHALLVRNESTYAQFMKGKISADEFIRRTRG